MGYMDRVAKAHVAGVEICEVLGVDWHNVPRLVITYEAGEPVTVSTTEYAERPDVDESGNTRYVKAIENDDLVHILREYELVEKSVEVE
jgi:hypothetical protein